MAIKLSLIKENLEQMFVEEGYIANHSDFLRKYKEANKKNYLSDYDAESISLEEFIVSCSFDKGYYYAGFDNEEEYAEDEIDSLINIKNIFDDSAENSNELIKYIIPNPLGEFTSQVIIPKSIAKVLYSIYTNPDYIIHIIENDDIDSFISLVDILRGIGLTTMYDVFSKSTSSGTKLSDIVRKDGNIDYFINNHDLD